MRLTPDAEIRGNVRSRGVPLQPDPDVLNLIVEVTGEARKDKAAKVTTARTLWVPAVNNHGGFGRWAFVEVTDPWDAQRTIRAAVAREKIVFKKRRTKKFWESFRHRRGFPGGLSPRPCRCLTAKRKS